MKCSRCTREAEEGFRRCSRCRELDRQRTAANAEAALVGILSPSDVPALFEQYRNGMPTWQIARNYGITTQALNAAFKRAGLSGRFKNGVAVEGGPCWTLEREHEHILVGRDCILCDRRVA